MRYLAALFVVDNNEYDFLLPLRLMGSRYVGQTHIFCDTSLLRQPETETLVLGNKRTETRHPEV